MASIGKAFLKEGTKSFFKKFAADLTAYVTFGKELGSIESYMSSFVFGGALGASGLKGGWKAAVDILGRPAYSIIVDDMLFRGDSWNWQKYGVNVAIRGLTYGLTTDLQSISRGLFNGLYYQYQLS